MRRWLPTLRWTGAEIVDVAATGLLGLALCASLVVFVAYRLSAKDWWPEVHGLSENGAFYLSVSRAGMRVHEVASGKEIDRLTLRGPWESLVKEWRDEREPRHPLEMVAPDGFKSDEYQFEPSMRQAYAQPQVLISNSGRYVASQFPAGYALLWDRFTDRFTVLAEPEYFFEQLSFDEARGLLVIEALPKPKDVVQFPREDAGYEVSTALKNTFAIDVICYRLSDFTRASAEKIVYAGERINGKRNIRLIDDASKGEICVIKCDDFPFGSQKVIHRIKHENLYGLGRAAPRLVEDRLYFASWNEQSVDFYSWQGKDRVVRRLPFPKDLRSTDHAWFADGCATLGDGDYVNGVIAIWDEDFGVATFEVPDLSFTAGVKISEPGQMRRVRVAGARGEVIDLPIGSDGPVKKRQMELAAMPMLLIWMSMFVGGLGITWSLWAAAKGRFFAKGGWQTLLLILLWPAAFWAIELILSRAPHGFQFLALIWLLFGVIGAASGMSILAKGGAWRAGVVCACALFAMLVLSEVPSRFQAVYSRPPVYGCGGCCIF